MGAADLAEVSVGAPRGHIMEDDVREECARREGDDDRGELHSCGGRLCWSSDWRWWELVVGLLRMASRALAEAGWV